MRKDIRFFLKAGQWKYFIPVNDNLVALPILGLK